MNKLIIKDNLEALKELPDKIVDLVYLDPPYFSNRNYYNKDNELQFTDKWDSQQQYLDFIKERLIELHRISTDTSSIYLQCDTRMDYKLRLLLDDVYGENNWRNSISWCYYGPNSSPFFPKKHDTLLFYSSAKKINKDAIRIPYRQLGITSGFDKSGTRRMRQEQLDAYLKRGKCPEDFWIDIGPIRNQNEKNGYPTQKPSRLLERIILASSNKGDTILDPFTGSGTTLEVANKLGRNWIGIDNNENVIDIINKRDIGEYQLIK